jgi:rhodanese-related sulfurtransferase
MKQRVVARLLSILFFIGLISLSGRAITFTQDNQTNNDHITVSELKALVAKNEPVVIIDVRGSISSKIKGAMHIPLGDIETRIKEIPTDKQIVTYCSCPSEQSSARAAEILKSKGFKNVRALTGGTDAWASSGGAMEDVSATAEHAASQPTTTPTSTPTTQKAAENSTTEAKTTETGKKKGKPKQKNKKVVSQTQPNHTH